MSDIENLGWRRIQILEELFISMETVLLLFLRLPDYEFSTRFSREINDNFNFNYKKHSFDYFLIKIHTAFDLTFNFLTFCSCLQ